MNHSPQVQALFEAFAGMNILVFGDLMLDKYLVGKVSRISPEAPVPVVEVVSEDARPGGAANVALNVAALGCKVHLAGVVGMDEEGDLLLHILAKEGFDTNLIFRSGDRPTTRKTRIIGNSQHMLRVDREDRSDIREEVVDALSNWIQDKIGQFDAIIFQDYDKGLLNGDLIIPLVHMAASREIPTIVDPKFKNFLTYDNCTVFKPNLKELNEAMGYQTEKSDLFNLEHVIHALRKKMGHQETVVTLSENGVFSMNAEGKVVHTPAHVRKIADVSGAGDTVVSVLAACKAAGIEISKAAAIANLAGGLVCEEVGVVPIDRDRLGAEIERLKILS